MGEAMKATRIVRFVLAAGLLAGVGVAQNLDVAAASTGDHDRGAIFVSTRGATTNSGEFVRNRALHDDPVSSECRPEVGHRGRLQGNVMEDVVVSSPLTLKGRDATIKGTATTTLPVRSTRTKRPGRGSLPGRRDHQELARLD